LHVLIGYTAQPSGMQVVFYAVTLVMLVIGIKAFKPSSQPVSQPTPLTN
jgi:hypothetical protein